MKNEEWNIKNISAKYKKAESLEKRETNYQQIE